MYVRSKRLGNSIFVKSNTKLSSNSQMAIYLESLSSMAHFPFNLVHSRLDLDTALQSNPAVLKLKNEIETGKKELFMMAAITTKKRKLRWPEANN